MNLLQSTTQYFTDIANTNESLGSFGDHAFQMLVTISLIGSLIVLVSLALHCLFRKRLSAKWLYLLWLVVIVRFALFAVPKSPTSFLNLVASNHEVSTQADFEFETSDPANDFQFDVAGFDGLPSSETPSGTPSTKHLETESTARSFDWWQIAKIVWLTGFSFFIGLLVVQWFRVRKLVRNSIPADADLNQQFTMLKHEMGIKRSISLATTSELEVPAMAGLVSTTVLLPDWCTSELSARELNMVMAHELTHIRRHDGLAQLFAYLVKAVHWFNPLVGIAERLAAQYRELSCDSKVVELFSAENLLNEPSKHRNKEGIRREYGKTILKVAGRATNSKTNHPVFVGLFLGHSHLIKQRIAMLTKSKSNSKTATVFAFACLLSIVAVGFTSAQTPQDRLQDPSQDSVENEDSQTAKETAPVSDKTLPEKLAHQPQAAETKVSTAKDERKKSETRASKHLTKNFTAWHKIGLDLVPMAGSEPKVIFSLLVMNVKDGSKAQQQGIQKGDHLFAIDGWNTDSLENVAVVFDRKVIAQPNSKGITDLRFFIHRPKEQKLILAKPVAKPLTIAPASDPESSDLEELVLFAGDEKRLTYDFNISSVLVTDPEIFEVTPVAPNTIVAKGLKPGISWLVLSNTKNESTHYLVRVMPNVKKRDKALKSYFPDSELVVEEISDMKIKVTGSTVHKDQVENIITVLKDYYPEHAITSEVTFPPERLVAVKVQIFEVSTTKLNQSGIDWSAIGLEAGTKIETLNELALMLLDKKAKDSTVGTATNPKKAQAILAALEEKGVAKLLDQPVLVGSSRQPMSFLSGKEITVPLALPTEPKAKIELRNIGTKIEMVPSLDGKEEILLDLRVEVSKVEPKFANSDGVPGFSARRLNTGIRVGENETIVLSNNFTGPSNKDDTELLFFLTPKFVEKVEVMKTEKIR